MSRNRIFLSNLGPRRDARTRERDELYDRLIGWDPLHGTNIGKAFKRRERRDGKCCARSSSSEALTKR